MAYKIKENKCEDGKLLSLWKVLVGIIKLSDNHVFHYYSSNGKIELINGEFVELAQMISVINMKQMTVVYFFGIQKKIIKRRCNENK